MSRTDFFKYKKFRDININDPFFDTLKDDYAEFEEWFSRKENESAYVHEDNSGVQAFLYLKIEEEESTDIDPNLPLLKRVKIGTLKINPHGTRFGERFIKKAFDLAIENNITELYVTIFQKHKALITLLKRYGFYKHGKKSSKNGIELVFIKNILEYDHMSDLRNNYPLINITQNSYLLSIYPEFHSRLFPDSILNTENPYNVIKDVSFSNSIEKIYICRMPDAINIKPNDNIVMYRTKEKGKSAEYSAVASSVCTVVEVKTREDFKDVEEAVEYCLHYSIFTESEIRREFYNKNKPMIVIRMLYNAAFKRRIIRRDLADICGIDRGQYWGIIKLSEQQFSKILELGEVNEGTIIY